MAGKFRGGSGESWDGGAWKKGGSGEKAERGGGGSRRRSGDKRTP